MYPKLKPLEQIDASKKRLLLLQTSADEIEIFIKNQSKPELFKFEKNHSVELSYENYSMHDALKILIASENLTEKDVPSGFELIGDIAHLNLNEKQFPFRYQVG